MRRKPRPTAQPDITKVPAAAQPSDHFDVDAATDAYLALMPASAKARSDAYFEGGYWLILWDFLFGAVIALLLLNLGWSACDAQPGGAHHALQVAADLYLLGGIPAADVGAGISDGGV